MESRPLKMINVGFSNKKDDFIKIDDRDYKIVITGKIKQGHINYIGINDDEDSISMYNGLYIEFNDSVIFLNNADKYILQGHLLASEEEAKIGSEKFNLQNVWSGNILSNKLEISII